MLSWSNLNCIGSLIKGFNIKQRIICKTLAVTVILMFFSIGINPAFAVNVSISISNVDDDCELLLSMDNLKNGRIKSVFDKVQSKNKQLSGEDVVFEDNILPYVKISQPKPGFLYCCSKEIPRLLYIFFNFTMIIGPIFVVVIATDNVGIESVSFYIDDVIRTIVTEQQYPPDPFYVWLWNEQSMMFPYHLKVVAKDYAGNEASDMIKVWRFSPYN